MRLDKQQRGTQVGRAEAGSPAEEAGRAGLQGRPGAGTGAGSLGEGRQEAGSLGSTEADSL